ncbi:MAG: cell division protein FtsA [Opitutaceae bacterium]|nr:cell division protein FtsA [Opitutaceae bacterium]
MSSSPQIIGAVEIGTSKVTAVIGEYTGRELAIIGHGECQSHGVTKGMVWDYKAASECTHSALEIAERDAGEKVDTVFLAQTGAHLEGFYNEASVNVMGSDNVIGEEDIRTVCNLARSKELRNGRMIVHHIRRPFVIDDRQMVPTAPENLSAKKLAVGYWTVHGEEQRLADTIHVIKGFNIEVSELVVSSLASGHVVTTAEERQHGVLAIDIGAGTTDYVLYGNGVPVITGVLAVGGSHLTNDLSVGLRLTEGQAEKLKLQYGRAEVRCRDKTDKVWLDGNFAIGDRQFPRHSIEKITSARVREIFEIVKDKLGSNFSSQECSAGVVLTGGTAKIPAIAEPASSVFQVPVHLGDPPVSIVGELRDPGTTTAIGTLYYGIYSRSDRGVMRRKKSSLLGGIRNLFSN